MKNFKTIPFGFTLTELMAVVVILAILLSMAAGSYKRAVEQSKFNDGLIQATTVMESVERYHAENVNKSGSRQPHPRFLDMPPETALGDNISYEQDSNGIYFIKSAYFKTYIYDGYVDAKREGSAGYTVRVYSSTFGNNLQRGSSCVYRNNEGKNLCVAVGYTGCDTNTSVCDKP